jgi:protein TonB
MQGTREEKPYSESARAEMPLGRCLVEGDPESASRARGTRRKTFGLSLAIEFLFVGLVIAVPLLTGVAQPQIHQILPPQLTFFGVWREHSPAQHAAPPTTAHTPLIPTPFLRGTPPRMPVNDPSSEKPGDVQIPDLAGGYVPGAVQVAEAGRTSLFVEPPHIAQPAPQEKHVVKLSEGVLGAQLISRIEPRYPAIAVETKTEGTVRLHAIISRDGRITSLDVLSGHPFLVMAALDAVRQWRYRPTLLNGEPVEVETSITVIFRLHE